VVNRLRVQDAEKPEAAPTRQEILLMEIRDLLRAGQGHAPPTQPV
jgi:hypothetical protein